MTSQTKEHPTLSIIIPAYNEATRLPATLYSYHSFFKTAVPSFEILVVDDGSTDGTADMAQNLPELAGSVQTISLAQNRGKGAAVQRGVAEARGSLILFADADGSTPAQEYLRLAAACTAGADVAIGSRALYSPETTLHAQSHRKLMGRIFNAAVNVFLLPDIADTQCGFKLFTAATAQTIFPLLTIPGFGFDLELLYLARLHRKRIVEVPVNWHHVDGSKVNLIRDATRMLGDIARIRWTHRRT